MPRSKTQSSSDDSMNESRDVRRRVVKACQRCRLKKCRCDGSTPCTRCKADDAICAYGKHKKSDKIIFRKGYVQMLERQHTQLIAGLQELYRCTQNGQGWTAPSLEPVNYGQPLTHKILEGLGVLRTDEWDDSDGPDGTSSWQSFEQQTQDDGSSKMYDVSGTVSPVTTTSLSPTSSAPKLAFLNSKIMAKRRSKYDVSMLPISQALEMPQPAACHSFNSHYNKFGPYSSNGPLFKSEQYESDLHLQIPQPMSIFNNNNSNNNNDYTNNNNGADLPFIGNLDWMSMTDDMFDHPGGHNLQLQVR